MSVRNALLVTGKKGFCSGSDAQTLRLTETRFCDVESLLFRTFNRGKTLALNIFADAPRF